MNYPYYPNSSVNPFLYPQSRPTYNEMVAQNQQYPAIKGRPVASFDEAKVSMIDFDGSVFYFPDIANKKIYTKQINMDGTSSLNTYALVENPIPQQSPQDFPSNSFITKNEFDSTISALSEEIQRMKGAMTKNDEPKSSADNGTAIIL